MHCVGHRARLSDVSKRALGWVLALIGFVSLIPSLFLAFFWLAEFLSLGPATTPGLQIRGGLFTLLSGPIVTILLFWSSARLLDSAHQERQNRVFRRTSSAAQ